MNFWKDGLSINETRISALIVGFIISLTYAIYAYHANGDISNNLLEVIKILVISIASINFAGKLSEGLANIKNNTKDVNQISNEVKGNTDLKL